VDSLAYLTSAGSMWMPRVGVGQCGVAVVGPGKEHILLWPAMRRRVGCIVICGSPGICSVLGHLPLALNAVLSGIDEVGSGRMTDDRLSARDVAFPTFNHMEAREPTKEMPR
jgi:hypothetical protein